MKTNTDTKALNSKTSVTSRLASLMLVPLIALLVASGFLVQSAWSSRESSEVTVVLSETAARASALVHELQKERGMSAGFIGSKGQKFKSELKTQRSLADTRHLELDDFLKQKSVNGVHKELDTHLRSAHELMSQVNNIRSRIDNLSIPLKDALGHYTQTNNHLIEAVGTLPKITPNPEITATSLAYLSAMYIKESAGIERAVLANTFAQDKFGPNMYPKFLGLVEKQRIFEHQLSLHASTDTQQNFDSAMQSAAAKKATKMRGVALANGTNGNFETNAKEWFQAQTSKINEIKVVEDHIATSLIASSKQVLKNSQITFWGTSGLTLFVVMVTLWLGINTIRKLSEETHTMIEALDAIASGDLTEAGIDYSKVGGARSTLDLMRHKLTEITGQIQQATHTVRDNSREISEKNHSLATRAEQQAQHLETTATSMGSITQAVQQNAADASKGNLLSKDAMEHARDGQNIVSQAVNAMAEINDDSKKIADIINVIDDIAFQTNLLALNAAVEAARAGDQGRGFAVVATEVRNLAQRSAEAAHEIKSLIEASVGKVEKGSDLVNASGQSLDKIVSAVDDSQKLMNQIAESSEEQAQNVASMNDSITGLDSANQENTAMVEEVAVASRELQLQASLLSDIAAYYKVSGNQPARSTNYTQAASSNHKTKSPQTSSRPVSSNQATPQARPQVERRSAERPWSQPPQNQSATQPVRSFKKAAGSNEEWTSF